MTKAMEQFKRDETAMTQKRDYVAKRVKQWSEANIDVLKGIATKAMGYDKIVQTVTLAIQGNPGLYDVMKTAQGQASMLSAMMESVQVGLPVYGPNKLAYLIPRKRSGVACANFQISYMGKIALLYRSGLFSSIDFDVYYPGDGWIEEKGTQPTFRHAPMRKAGRKEQVPIAYYAIAYPKDGGMPTWVVMSLDDCLEVRDRIHRNNGKGTPWATDQDAMCLKTVVHRLCKRLPQAEEAYTSANQEDDSMAESAPLPVMDAEAEFVEAEAQVEEREPGQEG